MSIEDEDRVISHALDILEKRMKQEISLTSPESVRIFLQLRFGDISFEVFGAIYLNVNNQFIDYEELFRGTMTEPKVYIREIVKSALLKDAKTVILFHNHRSGDVEPSASDMSLTGQIRDALSLMEIDVLDHFIVSRTGAFSFAENNML